AAQTSPSPNCASAAWAISTTCGGASCAGSPITNSTKPVMTGVFCTFQPKQCFGSVSVVKHLKPLAPLPPEAPGAVPISAILQQSFYYSLDRVANSLRLVGRRWVFG